MDFRVLRLISKTEIIATGKAIREMRRLRKAYGAARWRKLKCLAEVQLGDGTICKAEIHWYEAHGIGKKEFKIKRIFARQG